MTFQECMEKAGKDLGIRPQPGYQAWRVAEYAWKESRKQALEDAAGAAGEFERVNCRCSDVIAVKVRALKEAP